MVVNLSLKDTVEHHFKKLFSVLLWSVSKAAYLLIPYLSSSSSRKMLFWSDLTLLNITKNKLSINAICSCLRSSRTYVLIVHCCKCDMVQMRQNEVFSFPAWGPSLHGDVCFMT